jgi:SAM-dependent methyltransferase
MHPMRNPWLDIPLADYEAHMALPAIGQSLLIAEQLEILIRAHSPRSVAVIGCAGGNGFDRLIDTTVERVVGVDINPNYIEAVRRRYAGRISLLDLHIADIQSAAPLFEAVDLIYVALVLEYVDPPKTMSALWRHCKPGGVLALLSQLPHESMSHVTPSPYSSLRSLAPAMRLVAPEDTRELAKQAGFSPERSSPILSAGGKRFGLAEYRRWRASSQA